MKADRVKIEKLFYDRSNLLLQLKMIDDEIVKEQSNCTCPNVEINENGDKFCPDCLYIWSTDY